MAMTTCKECKSPVPRSAKTCLACGAEGPNNVSAGGMVFVLLAVFLMVSFAGFVAVLTP